MSPQTENVLGLAEDWPRPVILFDRDYVVTFANQAVCETFEVSSEHFIGQKLWKSIGLDGELKVVKRAVEDSAHGRTAEFLEWAACTQTGKSLYLKAKLLPFGQAGFGALALDDCSIERELSAQLAEHLAADEALLSSLPTTLLRIDYQGSLVRLCDNGNLISDKEMTDGFMWTIALPTGLGEAVCDAMARAKLEQKSIRFRHSQGAIHIDAVVTPCGMSDTLIVLHDVTDTVMLDKAKKDAFDRMRLLVEGSDNVLALMDRDMVLGYVSPSVERVLGVPDCEMSGRHLNEFLVDPDRLQSLVESVLQGNVENNRGIFTFKKATGDTAKLEVDVRNHLGDPLVDAIVINANDVTELLNLQDALEHRVRMVEDLNEDLARQATTDAMTGLHNYFSFAEHFKQALAQSNRDNTPLSVLLIDIDFFKKVNDTRGHLVGDNVLKTVAERIRSVCRKSDLVARYGGEEFVVMMPGSDENGALTLAKIIWNSVRSSQIDDMDITVSIGVATSHNDFQESSFILQSADKALYFSKHNGRDKVTHVLNMPQAA